LIYLCLKIDRLFGWKTAPQSDVVQVIDSQAENTKAEFEKRTQEVIVQLAEQVILTVYYIKESNFAIFIHKITKKNHKNPNTTMNITIIVN
jgi:translation initiation factor IF-2